MKYLIPIILFLAFVVTAVASERYFEVVESCGTNHPYIPHCSEVDDWTPCWEFTYDGKIMRYVSGKKHPSTKPKPKPKPTVEWTYCVKRSSEPENPEDIDLCPTCMNIKNLKPLRFPCLIELIGYSDGTVKWRKVK